MGDGYSSSVRQVTARRRARRPKLELLEERQLLATLFVTNTSGAPGTPGSLPFEVANSANGDVIDFSKLGPGSHAITLTQTLTVNTSITIDGSTAVGFQPNTSSATDNAIVTIEIDGAGSFGIVLAAAGITVQDLAVIDYGSIGLDVNNVANATIAGNFIGIEADGATANGGVTGVKVEGAGASGATIGGAAIAARNLVGGNSGNGIWFTTSASAGAVAANFIGVGANGSTAVRNVGNGVLIDGAATGITIGGTAAVSLNVISGNSANGILISGVTNANNLVEGNFIGVAHSGAGPSSVGNGLNGVALIDTGGNTIGGTATGARNVISDNHNDGILIKGVTNSTNSVQGNFIGTDASGTAPLGNHLNGVELEATSRQLIGGTASGAGNVIAANGERSLAGAGVQISGNSTGNELLGNYIGTDSQGDPGLGNQNDGVLIETGAANNSIGGLVSGARNVISGNNYVGVHLTDVGTSNNVVYQNFIGTNFDGTTALPNFMGVYIGGGAANNTVGAPGLAGRNVISGNGEYGIRIDQGSTNTIAGNFIGLNLNGQLIASATQAIGVSMASSAGPFPSGNSVSENVISGNVRDGVQLYDAESNSISRNTIGLDPAGNLIALSKQVFGIIIQSDADGQAHGNTVAGNVISGNQRAGVYIDGTSNHNALTGNMIGVDPLGRSARPNGVNGIVLTGGAFNNTIGGTTATPGTARGNVISGNGANGVLIAGSGTNSNVLEGNFIGTDRDGQQPVGNSVNGVVINQGAQLNVIGGTGTASRNIISGSGLNGVLISGVANSTNLVQGNFIGTDITGTLDLANSLNGVKIEATTGQVIGGTAAGARNVISGNGSNGILISAAQSNTVSGNYIGTGVKGSGPLGNGASGVRIDNGSTNNMIGGTSTAGRNVIAANAIDGVMISAAQSNRVSGNFIGVGSSGLGLGNKAHGVEVANGSQGTLIGGGIPTLGGTLMFGQGAGNLISGNGTGSTGDGVLISGGSTGIAVLGNAIGTAADDASRLGNKANGVEVVGSTGTMIGGTIRWGGATISAGNLISSNGFNTGNALPADATAAPLVGNGVLLRGSNHNTIALDYIGVGLARVQGQLVYANRLGNFNDGIALLNSSGNTVGDGSPGGAVTVISGNGNLQSAEALYTLPDPGRAASPDNVPQVKNRYLSNVWTLTANVFIGPGSTGNVVQNSNIGTNALGNNATLGSEFVNFAGTGLPPITPGTGSFNPTQDRPSVTEVGVLIVNASRNTVGPNNVISANSIAGVQIVATGAGTETASGNRVAGNIVGLARDGKTPLPNGFSTYTSAVNAFSTPVANDPQGTQYLINNGRPGSLLTSYGAGIFIEGTGASHNTIGGADQPLAGSPITRNSGNVISANWGAGVRIVGDPINQNGRVSNVIQSGAAANTIEGNLIGTEAVNITGATSLVQNGTVVNPLGNSQSGVFIQDSSNGRILKNVISENEGSGVYLVDNSGAQFGQGLTVNILVTGNTIGGDISGRRRAVGLGNRFWGVVRDSGAALVKGSLARNIIINNLNGPFFNTILHPTPPRFYIQPQYRPFQGTFPPAELVKPPSPRAPRLGWSGAARQVTP